VIARPRWLLLNPPSVRRVVRDCYCSEVVKAGYYWHPMDLIVQGALLARVAEVVLVDAVAEGLGERATMHRIAEARPDAALVLVGDVARDGDRAFCRRLRAALPRASLYGSGDVFTEDPRAALDEFDALDGALLCFVSGALATIARGAEPVGDVALRGPGGVRVLTRSRRGTFSHPPPPPGLFRPDRYRLPFYGGAPFYSLLTSYGCPFACRFCHVPSLGYLARPVDEAVDEVRAAVLQGFSRFYVRDATFGIDREDAVRFCEGLIGLPRKVRWNAFARADGLADDLLDAMAASGCAVVQIGVETLDPDACRAMGKICDLERLAAAIAACRRRGVLTSLHFVLGLPGDAWVDRPDVLRDLLRLGADYVSLNVLRARPGTALHGEGIALGADREAGLRARAAALHRGFYLRPARVAREIARLRDPRSILRAARLFAGAALTRAGG
jgi:hypothetical protein